METLGVIGFIFALAALSMVLQQKKVIETLKKVVDELTYWHFLLNHRHITFSKFWDKDTSKLVGIQLFIVRPNTRFSINVNCQDIKISLFVVYLHPRNIYSSWHSRNS